MPKRRHTSPQRQHQQTIATQKDIAAAIIASTVTRLQRVPVAYRPTMIERNGVAALTYASKGDVMSMEDCDGGTDNLIRWAITTDQVDRANDRVDPRGINIKRYLDNPVILWNHDASQPPIGRGVGSPRQTTLPDGRRAVVLDVLFHDITREARDIADLVRAGFLRANSIGFIPLSFHDESVEGYADAYDWTDTVRVFDTWELLEDSICTIPMNPGALVQDDGAKSMTVAVERGIIAADSPILRDLAGPIIITTPRTTTPTLTTPRKSMPHDSGCAMLALADADASAILDFAATIADGDLAPDGREDAPHITVKYGVNVPAKVLTALLADVAPFAVTLGEVSVFAADDDRDSDVVKIDVVGRPLVDLNELICDTFACEDTYNDYAPHITLAYVKAGRGAAYEGVTDLTGNVIDFTEVTYVAADGTTTIIPLGGKADTTVQAALQPATMTTKDVTTDAVAAPAAAVDPNATPAPAATPEAAPTAPVYNDAAYIDKVLAAMQMIVAESTTATLSSIDDKVKEAAQSAIDILTPGIEEFVALKDALAPAPEAPPAADPAAPAAAPVAPAPAAAMSWKAAIVASAMGDIRDTSGALLKAGAVISAKNRVHLETIFASVSALLEAANAGTITDEAVALTYRSDGATVYVNNTPLSEVMARAIGVAAATATTTATPTATPLAEAVTEDARALFAHLLDVTVS